MDKKVIIGIVVAVVVVLGAVPLLSKAKQGGGGEAPAAAGAPSAAADAPLLNASNLTGTAWEVKPGDFPIAVTVNLNAGGKVVATVPAAFAPIAEKMIGASTLNGTWSVEGAKLTISIIVKDKAETVVCDIVGDKIVVDGKEAKRL